MVSPVDEGRRNEVDNLITLRVVLILEVLIRVSVLRDGLLQEVAIRKLSLCVVLLRNILNVCLGKRDVRVVLGRNFVSVHSLNVTLNVVIVMRIAIVVYGILDGVIGNRRGIATHVKLTKAQNIVSEDIRVGVIGFVEPADGLEGREVSFHILVRDRVSLIKRKHNGMLSLLTP